MTAIISFVKYIGLILVVSVFLTKKINPTQNNNQELPSKQTEYLIFSTILNFCFGKQPYSYILVSDSTSKTAYHGFNFQDYDSQIAEDVKMILSPSWQIFVKNINIAEINNFKLLPAFNSQVNVCLRSQIRVNDKPSELNWPLIKGKPTYDALLGGLITFTPVYFSADGKKALCGIYFYENSESASNTLYFLERKDNST